VIKWAGEDGVLHQVRLSSNGKQQMQNFFGGGVGSGLGTSVLSLTGSTSTVTGNGTNLNGTNLNGTTTTNNNNVWNSTTNHNDYDYATTNSTNSNVNNSTTNNTTTNTSATAVNTRKNYTDTWAGWQPVSHQPFGGHSSSKGKISNWQWPSSTIHNSGSMTTSSKTSNKGGNTKFQFPSFDLNVVGGFNLKGGGQGQGQGALGQQNAPHSKFGGNTNFNFLRHGYWMEKPGGKATNEKNWNGQNHEQKNGTNSSAATSWRNTEPGPPGLSMQCQ